MARFEALKHFACNSRRHTHDCRHTQNCSYSPELASTPIITIMSAVTTKAVSVKPLMGLLLEPIMPTRYPEIAAKKKAKTINTVAATIAGRKDVLNIKT